MTFQEALNAIAAGSSDYATAKKLGISRQSFSSYRNGYRLPSDEILDRMSEVSGIPPERLYLAVYAEKLHNPRVAEAFRRLAS
ncbi:helix-turn-helix domain-containing protein [Bowmanella denitrificans]|uniref:helix-turn-helix domain-containing protein n=1 Tax=Bowmanella denitrificans TaxID=366582 RepID=UPI0011AFBE67|nr:helix-turn-helix transcriptional regulator [Bowmanella denitrificans]